MIYFSSMSWFLGRSSLPLYVSVAYASEGFMTGQMQLSVFSTNRSSTASSGLIGYSGNKSLLTRGWFLWQALSSRAKQSRPDLCCIVTASWLHPPRPAVYLVWLSSGIPCRNVLESTRYVSGLDAEHLLLKLLEKGPSLCCTRFKQLPALIVELMYLLFVKQPPSCELCWWRQTSWKPQWKWLG